MRTGLLALCLTVAWPAVAVPETSEPPGVTFMIAGDQATVLQTSGSGTLDDPFVVVERISGTEPVVLEVHGLSPPFGNRVRTHHLTGFALHKVVINDTTEIWSGYQIELQEELGQNSPYGDGLSFGQLPGMGPRGLASDGYRDARAIDEPLDGVVFSQGMVRPGEQVVFRMVITDTTPQSPFYLIQRRERPVAWSR